MEIVVHWDRNILILSGDNEKFAGFVPFYFLYFFFFFEDSRFHWNLYSMSEAFKF